MLAALSGVQPVPPHGVAATHAARGNTGPAPCCKVHASANRGLWTAPEEVLFLHIVLFHRISFHAVLRHAVLRHPLSILSFEMLSFVIVSFFMSSAAKAVGENAMAKPSVAATT